MQGATYCDSESMESLPSTIDNIIQQKSLRWVFVGGKGGVGKTTCSCSVSIQLSKARKSVLLISTDPAHNLSDAFCQKFSKEPLLVTGFTNLYAMEIDPTIDMAESYDVLQDPNAAADGSMSLFQELANAIPGIDEAMSFAQVMKLVRSMDYEVIVFDTAPTGHTLRLLAFPSILEKGLGKLLQLKNRFGGMLSQFQGLLGANGGFDFEAASNKLVGMKEVIEEVNKQFKDPDKTTFVCVCIAEFL
eukprot:Sdes_comp16096_c0_seq1m5309